MVRAKFWWCWMTMIVAALAAGSASAADGPKDAPKKSAEQPAKTAKPVDRFAVPDGTSAQLVEYVKRLVATPPEDEETRVKMRKSILRAAEKILAGKPNAEQREFGVQAKMNMLVDERQLAQFADQLKKDGYPELAAEVRGFMLYREIGQSVAAGPKQVKRTIAKAMKFFEQSPPQTSDRLLAIAFLQNPIEELTGDREFAVAAYRSLAKSYAAAKDKQLAEFADLFAATARRLDLVGKEMIIKGKTLDGAAFDLSKYAGKVVLVQFFATWCRPCMAALPDLRGYYDRYHAKGLEVVGISEDRRRADLDEFVKTKKIPWPIVYGDDEPSETAAYYGVRRIPATILIGRDGKVVSLDLHGQQLDEKLAKLLDPANEKTEGKSKASVKTPAKSAKTG